MEGNTVEPDVAKKPRLETADDQAPSGSEVLIASVATEKSLGLCNYYIQFFSQN